ncbi:hypothetical protein VI26_11845 [Chromobacterium sp. LK1]|uniref:hypothetical protein n=1 Tax=Chromobacterium sp. LK1 TaxID=1628193 RepID=UPI000653D453|nr:hypothetical protein [Chromobacterium sp. LK1]KMN35345.1 hypothetical protein VI26_11845 [Chromobacterium sp. LK1]
MKTQLPVLLFAALLGAAPPSRAASLSVDSPAALKRNAATYKRDYIDPKGAYADASIFSAVTGTIGGEKSVLLFLRLKGQCRVVHFSPSSASPKNGILLDAPWCQFSTAPTVTENQEFARVKYAIRVKSSTSSEEIKLDKHTGEICSNSWGNTELTCP